MAQSNLEKFTSIAAFTANSISILSIFVFFIFIIYKHGIKRKSITFPLRCLIFLQATNIGLSLTDWYLIFGIPEEGTVFCFIQAIQGQSAFLAVFFWNVVISLLLFFATYFHQKWLNLSRKILICIEIMSHIIVWGLVIILSVIPVIPTNTYGKSGIYCWISDKKPNGQLLRYLTFYVPLWICIVIVFISSIMTLIKIRSINAFLELSNSKKWTQYSKMVGYPILFLLVWVIPSINRILQAFGVPEIEWIETLHVISVGLYGFFNNCIYFFDLKKINCFRSSPKLMEEKLLDENIEGLYFICLLIFKR